MHRRGLLVLALPLLALLLLGGCGSAAADQQRAVATSQCSAPEFPPLQAGLHLVGDREPPVPYSSTPPTSGWHRSGVAGPGVAAEPLSEPVQVGLLEAGLVVVTHGPLPPESAEGLADVAADLREVVAVTPYPALADGEVAFAAWGVLQRCSGVDEAALRAFAATYGDPVATHFPSGP